MQQEPRQRAVAIDSIGPQKKQEKINRKKARCKPKVRNLDKIKQIREAIFQNAY